MRVPSSDVLHFYIKELLESLMGETWSLLCAFLPILSTKKQGYCEVNWPTTLQSVMNAKLSKHRFWPCHENGLVKTIHTIPHNLLVSFKSASLFYQDEGKST